MLHAVAGHKIEALDMDLAKTIGDTLERHYPGWGWMVHVNSEGGVVEIINGVMNATLHKQYGYILKYQILTGTHDTIIKETMRAGGELLERMNMPRSRWLGQDPEMVEGAEFRHQPIEYQVKEIKRVLGVGKNG